jgi:hypothetical protein
MHRFLTASLCLIAVGGLCAEGVAPTPALTPAQRAERREKCLAELKEKHPEAYKKIDANGDGDISGAEFGSFIEHREANFKEQHPDLFAAIDSNGDGKVDKDELKAAREARDERFKANHPKAFDKVDKNDDGRIQPGEAHDARENRRERRTDPK